MTTTMGAKNRSANLMDRRRISWNSRCNDGQKGDEMCEYYHSPRVHVPKRAQDKNKMPEKNDKI